MDSYFSLKNLVAKAISRALLATFIISDKSVMLKALEFLKWA